MTLEAIRRDGPLTRLELGRRSGLTAPGITNILRRLSDDRLINARKRAEPGGGQPSAEFAINPDGAFGVGVRLHGGTGTAVLLDLGGRVRDSKEFDATLVPGRAIEDIVRRLTADLAAPVRILGVGVGAEEPGALQLGPLLDALHPLKISVERDCVTALLAERTFGVGAVEGGIILIIVDVRVRAGFLFRGVPFVGVHSRAGSIGAMRTGADHVPLDSASASKRFERR